MSDRMTDERLAEIEDKIGFGEWTERAFFTGLTELLKALKAEREDREAWKRKHEALVVKLKARASAWEVLEKTVGIDGNQAAHQLRALLENDDVQT